MGYSHLIKNTQRSLIYSDTQYASQDEAEAAPINYSVFGSQSASGLIAVANFTIRGGSTNIESIIDYRPRIVGGGASSTTSITTLQAAYDNSSNPEIVVDTTRGGFTVRDGSTPIGGNLLEIENNAGDTEYLEVDVDTATFGINVKLNGHQLQESKGTDVASATALPILTDGNYFDVTGTATITSINTTGKAGTVIKLHFDGALTLTHHATDLILPGGANITTASGDEAEFIEYASGDFRCTSYIVAGFSPTALADKLNHTNGTTTGLYETVVALSALNVDLSAANVHTKTISASQTITTSGLVSGKSSSTIFSLTTAGTETITWTGVTWVSGVAPTNGSAGTMLVVLFSTDGINVSGAIVKEL